MEVLQSRHIASPRPLSVILGETSAVTTLLQITHDESERAWLDQPEPPRGRTPACNSTLIHTMGYPVSAYTYTLTYRTRKYSAPDVALTRNTVSSAKQTPFQHHSADYGPETMKAPIGSAVYEYLSTTVGRPQHSTAVDNNHVVETPRPRSTVRGSQCQEFPRTVILQTDSSSYAFDCQLFVL